MVPDFFSECTSAANGGPERSDRFWLNSALHDDVPSFDQRGLRRRTGTADCGTICFRLAPILPATLPPALAVFLLLPRNETDKR